LASFEIPAANPLLFRLGSDDDVSDDDDMQRMGAVRWVWKEQPSLMAAASLLAGLYCFDTTIFITWSSI
jgi:hypothetical protein